MSSDYINETRREYSLYVLQMRAIPHAADGLKAAMRRVLWTARNGKNIKAGTLSGAVMPIHPHAQPDGAINTLAAHYGNNIPFLHGEGAFGTLLTPTAYGATRYTSVRTSEFTNDVIFRDIELVPMKMNYDDTLDEPVHFLPLVPTVLLNPQEGIAVGFASSILPRTLDSIIEAQLQYLRKQEIVERLPGFEPTNSYCEEWFEDARGAKYVFKGDFEKINAVTIRVTNLPYGVSHDKYVNSLEQYCEIGFIHEYVDNSRDIYDITIKFKKGVLSKMDHDETLARIGLISSQTENFNVIDFDGERVWGADFVSMIERFTEWRLKWYKDRYERLASLLEIDIQRYKDVLTAIKKNVSGAARKVANRGELKEFLDGIGIVHLDYIADLSVYRFTEEEKAKTEQKLKDAEALMRQYRGLLKSDAKRRTVYVNELEEVLKRYKKGDYKVDE